jgi:hypothetical protein
MISAMATACDQRRVDARRGRGGGRLLADSCFVQTTHLQWETFPPSVPVRLPATAILIVNNVRDLVPRRRTRAA